MTTQKAQANVCGRRADRCHQGGVQHGDSEERTLQRRRFGNPRRMFEDAIQRGGELLR